MTSVRKILKRQVLTTLRICQLMEMCDWWTHHLAPNQTLRKMHNNNWDLPKWCSVRVYILVYKLDYYHRPSHQQTNQQELCHHNQDRYWTGTHNVHEGLPNKSDRKTIGFYSSSVYFYSYFKCPDLINIQLCFTAWD